MHLNEQDLISIYGTIEDLENNCFSTNACWKDYEQFKLGYEQTPYLPFYGTKYMNIIFCGINLNEGNTDIQAINKLVNKAKEYINDHKFKIFKQEGYGGSNFYYYVPLLSFMIKSIIFNNKTFEIEDDISWEQILNGFDYCAITNIIKCSVATPEGRSKPSDEMYSNCIPKFIMEIDKIKPKIVILFNKFLYPNMLEHKFTNIKRLIIKDRYNVSDYNGIKILELEHPMSTAVTRDARFKEYNNAILDLKSFI